MDTLLIAPVQKKMRVTGKNKKKPKANQMIDHQEKGGIEGSSIKSLAVGKHFRGSVVSNGEGVLLGGQTFASFTKPNPHLKNGQLVKVKVVAINSGSVQVEKVSTFMVKPSVDLIPKSIIKCRIADINNRGLLVRLSNGKVNFIHKSQIPSLEGADDSAIKSLLSSHYKLGSRVQAWVTKKQFRDGRPCLSLYAQASSPSSSSETKLLEESYSDFDARSKRSNNGDDSDEISNDEPEEVAPLEMEEGFEWTTANSKTSTHDRDELSDLELEAKQGDPKAKRHKLSLPEDLTAQIHAPKVASDFEKAILASPNSSLVWIQYMAYHLQMSALDKAREVARRALSTISLREEEERYNVHVAMLNLEFKFGDATSLDHVFQQARVMVNRPKQLHLQLAKLYQDGAQLDKAEAAYLDAVKKFPHSAKTWTHLGEFYLYKGQLEASRQTLQRSLKSLPKRKHLKAISKFGQLEFKQGEVERGRTIFEGIVANYPKRLDLWSIYLDMEAKALRQGRSQDAEVGRRLFHRVLKLKWSSQNMKFLFKKFLAYEQSHGLPHHIDHVKGMAMAYVQEAAL